MTENGVAQVPPDEDRTPTQEDSPPAPVSPPSAWVMPEPIFRRSDGYTPRVARAVVDDETSTAERDLHVSEDAAADGNARPIAEQPELAEEAITGTSDESEPAPLKKKGGFFRWLLIVLGIGIIALLALAGVVIGLIWYLSSVSESQNLN